MAKGPLGGPRPFADANAEVNIFFQGRDLPTDQVEEVRESVDWQVGFEGPVKGPVGTKNNVVTFQTSGNSVSMKDLRGLEQDVKERTGLTVGNIELIW